MSRFPIQVPPLRERAEDIPHLAEPGRWSGSAPRLGQALGLSGRAMGLLGACPWPENLAGLDAALEPAASRAEGGVIEPEHLPEGLARLPESPAGPGAHHPRDGEGGHRHALRAARGNHSRAAQALSISRNPCTAR